MLGELSMAERDAFEEHLADCSRCMEDAATLDAFAANARAEFAAQSRPLLARPGFRLAGLLPRLAPVMAFSGALNLVLLAVIGYGALRLLPSMRARIAEAGEPRVAQLWVVHGVSRSASAVYTVSRSGVQPVFRFDLPQRFAHYTYTIEQRTGGFRKTGPLAVAAGVERVDMTLPLANLEPGDYVIRIVGLDQSQSIEIGSWTLRVTP